MRASGHKTGTMVPPAPLSDTSLTSQTCKVQEAHRSRGQHYKTQSSIKSASETLQQVYPKPQQKFHFQKHSWEQEVRAPSYFHHQVAESCNSRVPRLQAALLHTSHKDVGANPECLTVHILWAFQLKAEQQKWPRTSAEISVQLY